MDPRYPIAKYEPKPFSQKQKEDWFADIQYLPLELEKAIENFDAFQLQTPYRDGGWTVQQVVHHVADSHLNAYCRFKLGLTEELPTIKAYDENLWSSLKEINDTPINVSITLLHALHLRWHNTLKNLSDDIWDRKVIHSETKKEMSLWFLLGMYAWHGKHHTAHINGLKQLKNW